MDGERAEELKEMDTHSPLPLDPIEAIQSYTHTVSSGQDFSEIPHLERGKESKQKT